MYDTRDMNLMKDTFARYEHLIHRHYLHELSCLPSITPAFCEECIQILEIKLPSDLSTYNEFSYILDALATLDETIGCIIISRHQKLSLYIGLKGDCPPALSLLENGLLQVFPNSTFSYIDQSSSFLDNLFDPHYYPCLASSVVVPNSTYSTCLLSQFIRLMGTHSDYVAFFLAQPICKSEMLNCLNEFYDIYNILSDFSQTTYTNYKSDSKTVSNSTAKGSSNTSSESITDTCGDSHSHSHNSYVNLSSSTPLTLITHRARTAPRPNNDGKSASSSYESEKSIITQTSTANLSPKNINATVLFNTARGKSSTNSSSRANGHTCGDSNSLTSTHGNSMSQTNYHSFSFSSPNKSVQDALTFLSDAILRYRTLSQHTSFCFGSYFFSPCYETSIRAAHIYTGLCQSSYTLSPNIVNHWCENNAHYASIYKCLRHFIHPEFHLPNTELTVASTIPILSSEFINNIYLPIT